ncbi:hypothetical protein M5K25_018894 [Dendrobium thyrsiflorum]|uniref:Uncharacterized protein n=1 Tax=Dendrobium thyrsiflorum TaxID=117978 RepID=A0ABD0UE87_DENTH
MLTTSTSGTLVAAGENFLKAATAQSQALSSTNTVIPPMSPYAMEYVSGIKIRVMKAGIPCLISAHSISVTAFIIITPTTIRAGPTAHGGIDASNGVKNSERIKYAAAVSAVSPVLPPSRIPVDDSINAVTGDVPSNEPATIAVASDMKAKYCPSNSPFSSTNPANRAME